MSLFQNYENSGFFFSLALFFSAEDVEGRVYMASDLTWPRKTCISDVSGASGWSCNVDADLVLPLLHSGLKLKIIEAKINMS